MRKMSLSMFVELVEADYNNYSHFFNNVNGILLVINTIDMCVDGMQVISIIPPDANNNNYGVRVKNGGILRTVLYKPDEVATFSVIETIKKEII